MAKALTTRQLYTAIRMLKGRPGLRPIYNIYVAELRSRRRETSEEVVVKTFSDTSWIIRRPIGQAPDRETAEIMAGWYRYERPNSPYDCTGQLFTQWQEVHYLGGQWWLWQSNAFDV